MTVSMYTLTYALPATQMVAELARLTAVLFQAPYAFLQTFHHAGHAAIDIFDSQQQLLVRVVLHADTPQGGVPLTAPPPPQTGLTPATLSLVQTLTRLWAPAFTPEVEPASGSDRHNAT